MVSKVRMSDNGNDWKKKGLVFKTMKNIVFLIVLMANMNEHDPIKNSSTKFDLQPTFFFILINC